MHRIRRIWDHAIWSDKLMIDALATVPNVPSRALRELSHVIGAEETWLSRLEGRPARLAVWPDLSMPELVASAGQVHDAYAAYLGTLREEDMAREIAYMNSAGRSFRTAIEDILMHVGLHGQYHRGKVNLMLREAGLEPRPVDFIAFARGTPAATRQQESG